MTTTKTYRVTLDGGEAGEIMLQAGNVRGALRKAREWAREGDWHGAVENPTANPTSEDYIIIRIYRPSQRMLSERSYLPSEL